MKQRQNLSIEERNRMVEENMWVVRWIAYQYRDKASSVDDLVQEGALELMRIANKFDASRGVLFRTYAATCVRRHFAKVISQDRNVYVPADTWMKRAEIRREIVENREARSDDTVLSSIIEKARDPLQNSYKTLRWVVGQSFIEHSMDSDITMDIDEALTLHGIIHDQTALSPEEEASANEEKEVVGRALSKLAKSPKGKRMRRVLKDRMAEKTLRQIGLRMGLTRERIRQIEKNAVGELRDIIEVEFRNAV